MREFLKYLLTLLLTLSFTSINASESLIDSLNKKADNYYESNSDSCEAYSNKALNLSKELSYQKGEMSALYQLSKLAYDKGDLANSLELAQQSLNIANSTDNYEGKTDALNVIAKVYYRSSEFNTSLSYIRKAYNIANNSNDSLKAASFLELMSTLKRSLNEIDSAFIFIRKAIKINKKIDAKRSLSYSYNNLGILHYNNNNIDSSLICFENTLKIRSELKAYKSLIQSYNNIGYILMQKGDTKNAINNFKTAIRLGRIHNVITYLDLSYENLTEAYEKKGDHNLALDTYKKYTAIKDSISGEKAKAKIIEVEQRIKLETEKEKAEELKRQVIKEKSHKEKQFVLIILLVLVLILTILILKTSKKRALETQLQTQKTEAAKAIIDEQEKVRGEIAQELHDGIGGSLAGLKLSLSNLQEKNNCPTLLEEISHLDRTYQNVRNISHNLTPVSFQKSSLCDTINNYLNRTFPNIESGICFQCYPEDELSQLSYDQQICVYRIIQELALNIQKHSFATNINIHLTGHETYLTIMAEDNGRGFDPKKEKEGIGLQNILKRITLYDGKIEIDSMKGNGTTIIIDIPYSNAK